MEIYKLVAGILVLGICTWILARNKDRKGFIHAVFRVDTLIGIIGGIYLILSSTIALLT
ncbi:MAG: hypothetical protein WA874_02075 [Chryseosolibacter sp.]